MVYIHCFLRHVAICQEFIHPVGGSCVPSCSGVAGDNITIQCGDGHVLQGSSTVTCQQNGTWSSSIPICVGEAFECAHLELSQLCK